MSRRQNTEDGFPRAGDATIKEQPRGDGMQANGKMRNPEVVGSATGGSALRYEMGVFNVFLRHVLCCAPLLIGFYLVW